MSGPSGERTPRTIDRYSLGGLLAAGGMAEVHLGQVRGAVGFSRTVAVKRMHPHFASDPDFASMFADEARLAARIRHPNVVATLDVVMQGGNLCIVMEYIDGVTLSQLIKVAAEQREPLPPAIVVAMLRDTLQGLHAAHEALDADGRPLGIVHRDVSPQNVMVGVDGIARVLDFGIAKANVRLHQTREGSGVKGKLAYMAPEQLEGVPVSRQSDVFAASVVLWEALTSERAFAGNNEGETVAKLLRGALRPPSAVRAGLDPAFDAVAMRGLARAPEQRFASAIELADALTAVCAPASAGEVGAWVSRVAAVPLAERTARVRRLETELRDEGRGAGSDGALPHAEAVDPDGTLPATPVARTDREETDDAPAAARSVRQLAQPTTRASRVRVAALVVAACALSAVAAITWTERRAASPRDDLRSAATSAHAAPAIAAAPPLSAASGAFDAPAAPSASAPSASASSAAVSSSEPKPAAAVAKTRRAPPRAAPTRPAPVAIPDHL